MIWADLAEAECIEIEGDGEAEEKAAEAVNQVGVRDAEVVSKERGNETDDETEVADGEETTGFGSELSSS